MADESKRRSNEEERRKNLDSTERLQEMFQAISQEIFGVSGAAFFDKVERSAEHMASLQQEVKMVSEHLSSAKIEWAEQLHKDLQGSSESIQSIFEGTEVLNKSFQSLTLDELKVFQESLGKISDDHLNDILQQFDTLEEQYIVLNAIQQDNLDALASMPAHIRTQVSAVGSLVSGTLEWKRLNESVVDAQNKYNTAAKKAQVTHERALTPMKGMLEVSDNLRKNIIKTAFEWDKVSNSIQRESGIMLSNLNGGFSLVNYRTAELTSNAAQFGLKLEDIGKFVGEIGEELRTTNTVTIDLAQQFAAISMATGISSKETAEIASNLIKMGHSSNDVYEYFEETNLQARALGVNSRKVLQDINKNLRRMQSFGFTQGEESLSRMALRAAQLRIEIDEIFDVSEKARSIEGAMEMAAQLQLAGGSFSNIDPGSLLAAARQGPEEMQKILSKMGSDIGRFNEKGEFKVDPIDGDRLRIVAEATGMKYESLFEIIRRNALDAKKVGDVFGDSFFATAAENIDSMDAAMAKSAFSDLLEIKDGEIVLNEDGKKLLDANDIKDWKSMTSKDLSNIMNARQEQALSLEEQARENMSMRQSMDSLVSSIANTITVFQPIIELFTGFINWINQETGIIGKAIAGAIIGGLSLIGPIMMKAFAISKMGKFFGGAGQGLSGLGKGIGDASNAVASVPVSSILKFGLALAIIGTSVVGFSVAMSQWGGETSLNQMASAAGSLVLLAGGVALMSKVASTGIDMKGVIQGSIAMGIIGASLIPFAFALSMMSDITWPAVIASLTFMGLAIGMIYAMGAVLAGPQIAPLLVGLGILVGIGGTMMLVAASLLVAGSAFEKLANINWSGFSTMGSALLSAAPGMVAFGIAAMAFANPISLIGILAMAGNLSLLNTVMSPLADNMERAADSMEKFVSQMSQLKSAVKEIDTTKLEEVSKIAEDMSKASRNNAIAGLANSIKEMFSSSNGSANSGGGTRELKIRLFLPNGRELQHKILEDTGLQSGR